MSTHGFIPLWETLTNDSNVLLTYVHSHNLYGHIVSYMWSRESLSPLRFVVGHCFAFHFCQKNVDKEFLPKVQIN
jgi:hypothetical protein